MARAATISRATFLALPPLLAGATCRAIAQTTPLRVGCAALDGYAEPYYAQDLGLFEKAGLNVEITRFNNGSQAVTAVASGAVDIGASSITAIANAYLHGIPLAYIAGANTYDRSNPDIGLCIAKSSSLRAPRELEGQTIAVGGLKDGTNLALDAYLIVNHVDVEKVRLIELPFPEMAAAIDRGAVTAATIVEPFLSAAIRTNARNFADIETAVGARFIVGGWFASRSWIEANAALARRFVAVIYDTARWANANHAQSGAILQTISRMDADTIAHMHRVSYAETMTADQLQPQLTWAGRLKFTDRAVNAGELIAKLG